MNMRWDINDGVLILRDQNDNPVVPIARDIYNHYFNAVSNIGTFKNVERVEIHLPEVEFSKFPLKAKVEVLTKITPSLTLLDLKVFAYRGSSKIEISRLNERTPDHKILDNKWYPISSGVLDDICELLKSSSIKTPGPITLKQYFDLLSHSEYSRVELIDLSFDQLNSESIPLPTSKPGKYLNASLYPYQQRGLDWLRWVTTQDMGGILADEMGLGKTLQIIALIGYEVFEKHRKPNLIFAPATLLENWRREFLKFLPDIDIFVHWGQSRTGSPYALSEHDVVITSYGTGVKDRYMLGMIDWNIIAADEAQAIKNPNAKRTRALKNILGRISIAITGTPLENHLLDLWSITDFAIPSYLGSESDFGGKYDGSIESGIDLERKVSPIMLRRLVKEVAYDLPEKINISQQLKMIGREAEEYDQVRIETLREYGKSGSLVSLLRLRQYCTHPMIIGASDLDNPIQYSTKYKRLIEILQELFTSNNKALIFTSFTKMIDILAWDLRKRFDIFVESIDGRVNSSARQTIVDKFSDFNGSAALVLNPKAAGTGLNIVAANHVIHYNQEWNPAIEDQATARAYRIGQVNNVLIHRLYYVDTVEEIIDRRIKHKRDLANATVVGTRGEDLDDIVQALQLTPLLE